MKKLSSFFTNKYIFIIAYALLVFSDMFDNVNYYSNILKFVDIFAVGLLTISFIFKFINKEKYDKKNVFILLLLLLLSLITAFISKNKSFIKLPILVLAMISIDFNYFIKCDLKIRFSMLIFLTFLSLSGIIESSIIEFRNGLPRYNFGMGHPNGYAFELVIIYFDILYLKTLGKCNVKDKIEAIMIGFILSVIIYLYIGSRTNLIMIFAIMIIFLLYKNRVPTSQVSQFIIKNMFLFFTLVSLYFAFIYFDNSVIDFIDKIFSGRLYLSNLYLKKYGVSLLGNNVINIGVFSIDNAFMNILIRFGVLITIMMAYLYNKTLKKVIDSKNMFLIYILLLLLLYGLSETPMYIPAKCPYILFFSLILMKENGGDLIETKNT